LRECVDSILAQTFDDYELVVVDDASTDDSTDILATYRGHKRTRIFRHEKNAGLFPTLNDAIRKSRAPLIHLLGQDDQMKRHCLERWDAFWREHANLGMAYCQRDTIDESGTIIESAPDDQTPTILSTRQVAQISFYHGSMPGNIASVVLRREALDEVGLFREDMEVSGDFEMWVRIAESFKTGFLEESLIRLRSHEDQFSRRPGVAVQFMEEDREIYERLFECLPSERKAHARRYHRWFRHVRYVHFMMCALWNRDLETASRVFTKLREWDSVPRAIGRWLITGNGRWLMETPKDDLLT
jgi:glycosyltransferase involved in cell wall biosynthesis